VAPLCKLLARTCTQRWCQQSRLFELGRVVWAQARLGLAKEKVNSMWAFRKMVWASVICGFVFCSVVSAFAQEETANDGEPGFTPPVSRVDNDLDTYDPYDWCNVCMSNCFYNFLAHFSGCINAGESRPSCVAGASEQATACRQYCSQSYC
jgi:hypothetical protein